MAYCRKCGVQLKDDDVFCFMCGQLIDKVANAEAEAAIESEVPVSGSARPVMSKEESIAVAEKLKEEYTVIERLQKEVNENETALKRPVTLSGKRYSAFRFFWPFFIYAYIAFLVIYFIGLLISAANDDVEGIFFTVILAFAAAIGLLIFGGNYAGRKRAIKNAEIAEEENMIRKRHKDLEARTSELKSKLTAKRQSVSERQNLVPIRFRKKHYMERILILIQTDRAADLYEAIDIISKN